MGKRWAASGLLAIVVMMWSAVVLADTGGSMGGGSWGGGGGGSYRSGGGGYSSSRSSSSSGWSRSSGWGGSSSSSKSRSYNYGSSSRDYSSSSGGSYSYSSGGSGASSQTVAIFLAFGVGAGIFIFFLAVRDSERSNSYSYSAYSYAPPSAMFNSADVSVLRIAIDGRARKFVQTQLKQIAQSANTQTEAGRSQMLREVALMLRRLRDAWVYGGAVNEPSRGIDAARPVFQKHVDDARARFSEEVIRNADGTITTREASHYTPRSDEGEGLILVTLVIAARRELFTVQRIGDGDDLRRALEGASQLTPDNLVAIEVIWQPAEEGDRLTSMELEAKYPRPDLIPIQNALVGKTFCEYCAGPFPAELVSCPHCGAPARKAA